MLDAAIGLASLDESVDDREFEALRRLHADQANKVEASVLGRLLMRRMVYCEWNGVRLSLRGRSAYLRRLLLAFESESLS